MSLQKLYRTHTAFFKFFQREYSNDLDAGAKYLFYCMKEGEPDSIVWDVLRELDIKAYTEKTLRLAATAICLTK